MDSDDEPMEEPPSDYYQTRRRSNTLPTEILRHLRDKHNKDKHEISEGDSDDEPDGEGVRNHGQKLSDKLKKVTISDHCSKISSNRTKKPTQVTPKSCLSPSRSNKKSVASYDDDPPSHKLSPNHRLDSLRNNLYRTTSDDTLMMKRRRKPLPRGSNVYEKALEDFGHNEEDRDFVSPLPSPQILRRGKHHTKHAQGDITQDLGSASPPRHVHWGQDARSTKQKR